MRIVEYQRLGIDINTLPVSRLRSIDIQTTDEEKLVAKLIAERTKGIVPQGTVYIDDIKARMDKELTQRTLTKEKELAYQKEIDERMAKAMPKTEVKLDITSDAPADGSTFPPEVKLKAKINKLKKK